MKSKKIFAQMLSLSFTFFLFPIIVNAASDWLWPVPSCKQITADRGYSYVSHKGIDIPGAYGANIVATKAGTIKTVYGGCTNHNAAASSGSNCESNGCHPTVNGATGLFYTMNGKKVCNYGSGNGVVIAHPDGTYSHYSHMSSTIVTQGQFVNQGDTIGYIGDSGNADGAHLHFTLTSGSTLVANSFDNNPLNLGYSTGISYSGLDDTISSVIVTTGDAKEITNTSAVLYGSATSTSGRITGCGMYLGTSASSMTFLGSDTINTNSTVMNYGTVKYGCPLQEGTTYYYQAYVIVGGQTYWGDIKEFRTTGNSSITVNLGAENIKLSYDSNGGSNGPGYQSTSSSGPHTFTILPTVPVREGYTFMGWSTDEYATQATYAPNGTITISQSTTLYAVWIQNQTYITIDLGAENIKLNYNSNGGRNGPGYQSTSSGGPHTFTILSTVPVREGYTFMGWSTDEYATQAIYAPNGTITISQSTTLYAVWSQNQTYFLDLNAYVNNAYVDSISGVGLFDIYINDTLVAKDVDDYYGEWPSGTRYEVKNIRVFEGSHYDGTRSTSPLSGLIENQNISVVLAISTSHIHTLTYYEAKAASCTIVGNIEYWHCSNCDKYFSDINATAEISYAQTKVAALGHNYVNGTCTRCGGKDPNSTKTATVTSGESVHFQRSTRYYQGQFSDVPAEQWFTSSVAEAVDLGLMKGSGSSFNPYGDVTLAEAITMAARINSIYATGMESFDQSFGNVWYQTYLDYAYQNNIINRAYYNADVTQKATRAQFAEIFANSLPTSALTAIGDIVDGAIPDISTTASYSPYVYQLYRAGVLTGGDAKGTFSPQTYITRAEAATIVSRMAESDNRVPITLH